MIGPPQIVRDDFSSTRHVPATLAKDHQCLWEYALSDHDLEIREFVEHPVDTQSEDVRGDSERETQAGPVEPFAAIPKFLLDLGSRSSLHTQRQSVTAGRRSVALAGLVQTWGGYKRPPRALKLPSRTGETLPGRRKTRHSHLQPNSCRSALYAGRRWKDLPTGSRSR